jgi:hypothetical protein
MAPHTPVFILVHSPLVGPETWLPTAAALVERGVRAVVPVLEEPTGRDVPFWLAHATSLARAVESLDIGDGVVLVSHSGAGPLMPAVVGLMERPVTAVLYVDAGLPHGGINRLDEMRRSVPDLASWLQEHLSVGGRFPEWTAEDLRPIVPDEEALAELLESLRPRAMDFFEEPLPDLAEPPVELCAYLRFSDAYLSQAQEAENRGMRVHHLPGGHFHQMVAPDEVAATLIDLLP